jgi:hypothetical protein
VKTSLVPFLVIAPLLFLYVTPGAFDAKRVRHTKPGSIDLSPVCLVGCLTHQKCQATQPHVAVNWRFAEIGWNDAAISIRLLIADIFC